jgi:hypothetical protein
MTVLLKPFSPPIRISRARRVVVPSLTLDPDELTKQLGRTPSEAECQGVGPLHT